MMAAALVVASGMIHLIAPCLQRPVATVVKARAKAKEKEKAKAILTMAEEKAARALAEKAKAKVSTEALAAKEKEKDMVSDEKAKANDALDLAKALHLDEPS